MTAGYISPTLLPGWPVPSIGSRETLDAKLANAKVSTSIMAPEGLFVGDTALATSTLAAYPGSADELNWHKQIKQAALDSYFDGNFDPSAFVRGGTVTNVTAAQAGNFTAQWTNNYRKLRSQISAGTTIAIVDAIDVTAGWPSNP